MERIKQAAWSNNILMNVMLELTYRCNLDCFYCYNDRGLAGKPLSKAQYFRLLDDLHEMGVFSLVLTGGEPLAHPEFFSIGARARELGFLVRIKSNGHALNHRISRRLKQEVDPFGIDISLHGATAATHDRQTRVPGSFDRLLNNFQALRDNGLRFRLNCTLTAWNEHETEAIFDLAESLGVPFNMSTSVTARDDGDEEPLSISPSLEGMQLAARIPRERSGKPGGSADDGPPRPEEGCGSGVNGKKACGTGSSTVTIDPVGNILPCVQWRRPVGNLHSVRISELWNHSADLDEIRRTSVEARSFVDGLGKKGSLMGYCIGQAVASTGSPLAVYPNAEKQADSRLDIVVK